MSEAFSQHAADHDDSDQADDEEEYSDRLAVADARRLERLVVHVVRERHRRVARTSLGQQQNVLRGQQQEPRNAASSDSDDPVSSGT